MTSQIPLASDMMTLYCWVPGDEDAFPVKTSPEITVGEFKKAILTEKPTSFKGIDPDKLVLWQPENLSDTETAMREFKKVPTLRMRPTHKISKYFPQAPPTEHIHIVIHAPGT